MRTRVRSQARPVRSREARHLRSVETKPYHDPLRRAWPGLRDAETIRWVVYRKEQRDPALARRLGDGALRRLVRTGDTYVRREVIDRPAGCLRGDTPPCARRGRKSRARRDAPEASEPNGRRATALPSDVGIARVRRKAIGGVDGMGSRLYIARATNVIEALYRPNIRNPYRGDVTVGPSRLSVIPEAAAIPGAREMGADGGLFPDDRGPASGQNEVGDEAS